MHQRRGFLKTLLAGALGFLGLSKVKALDPKQEFRRIRGKYPIIKRAVLESVEIHTPCLGANGFLYRRTDFRIRCDVYEWTDDPKKMTSPAWPKPLQVRPGWQRSSSRYHYSPDGTIITGHSIDVETAKEV